MSFAIVVSINGSSPNKSLIWSSELNPNVLNNTVTGSFLVLSTRT